MRTLVVLTTLLAGCAATSPPYGRVPPEAIEHFVDAKVKEFKGRYAEAIVDLNEALMYAPSSPGICRALARGYLRPGKLQRAIHFAERAVELVPNAPHAHRFPSYP